MPAITTEIERGSLVIEIGGMAVRLNTTDPAFLNILQTRYDNFITESQRAEFDLDVELISAAAADPNVDLRVSQHAGRWILERGDFFAEWDETSRCGGIRQIANPYSIDAVLRILHSIILVPQGGFLLHSASAIRNGKAFLFAGVSGAGKTTISRLAPADVTLLTDEISYVRKRDDEYIAFGTPFTGELAKLGQNCSAPIAALYLLAQGPENRIDPVEMADAGRELLANILFFAEDQEMVAYAFKAACDFVQAVRVYRLTFVPDARVWEMIG